MAKSTFFECWATRMRVRMLPLAAIVLATAVPARAATPQQISFASGHVVVEADPDIDRYAFTVSGAPGHCDPDLRVDEQRHRIAVRRGNEACQDAVVVTFHVNPAWAGNLDLELPFGQIDLAASIVASAARIEAKVGVGDIVGRSGVSRSWLLGARYMLDQQQSGPVIRAKVRSGQISFF